VKYILDINFILDAITDRSEDKDSYFTILLECVKEKNAYISSSSLHNIRFVLKKYHHSFYDKYILLEKKIKIAKLPAYVDKSSNLYENDIEDYLIELSAKAIDATIITSDKKFLKNSSLTISPDDFFINEYEKEKSIDFANLKKQYFMYQPKLERTMDKVLNNASYIMGSEVKELEDNLQNFTGAKHAITCSSGTDALLLAMMALDIQADDEIITTPFTFIATAETIAFLKAKPVFVDIDEKTYNIDPSKIEEKITSKTKAIMPVSLYGQPADMDAIQAIADKHKLKVIIDGAQSFGSTYKGKIDSNLGDISTTSFFPAKPLGCFGDGGAVFTNDDTLATKMKSLRVHGQSKRYHHQYIGMGGRMDTLQCAIVNVKLKHYKKDLALRQEIASKYTEALKNKDLVLPFVNEYATSAWAQYSIRVNNRDEVQTKLKEQQIPTAVHYPMPLHLQECFEYLGYKEGDFPVADMISKEIMSLPMNPYVGDDEIEYISQQLEILFFQKDLQDV